MHSRRAITVSLAVLVVSVGAQAQAPDTMSRIPSVTTVSSTDDSTAPRIRGEFHEDGAPLFVVNGLPDDPRTIDPADIESVTILQASAATAIYGSRGAYGVVFITTISATRYRPRLCSSCR